MAGSFLMTFSRDAPGSHSFAAVAQGSKFWLHRTSRLCPCCDFCRMYPEDDLNTLHRQTDRHPVVREPR